MSEEQNNSLTLNTEQLDASLRAMSSQVGSGVREIASTTESNRLLWGSGELAGAVATGYASYRVIRNGIKARNALFSAKLTALGELGDALKGTKDAATKALLSKVATAQRNFNAAQNKSTRRALVEALDELTAHVRDPKSGIGKAVAAVDEKLIDPLLDLERSGKITPASRLKFIDDVAKVKPKGLAALQTVKANYVNSCNTAIDNMFGTVASGSPEEAAKTAMIKEAEAGKLTPQRIKSILSKHKITSITTDKIDDCGKTITSARRTLTTSFNQAVAPTRTKILVERVSNLDEIVKTNGKVAASKFAGSSAPHVTSLEAGAAEVAKLETQASNLAAKRGKLSTFASKALKTIKNPYVLGSALSAATIFLAAASVDNLAFDPSNEEAINAISEKLQSVVPDGKEKYSKEKRQELIERALAASPDEKTRQMLEAIKAADYDYGKYIISKDSQIGSNLSSQSDKIADVWVKEQRNLFCTAANNQFYDQLSQQLGDEDSTQTMDSNEDNHSLNQDVESNEDQKHQDTQQSGDELATGELQPIDSTPKSEQEVCEEKLATAYTQLGEMLQKDPDAKPVLEKYLKGEKLTSEEEAKIAEYIPILTEIQNAQKELATLNGGKQTEGGLDNKGKSADSTAKVGKAPAAAKGIQGANLNPALLQPNAAQAALTRSGTQEGLTPEEIKMKKEMANLPPEAIVQQPEEESFWTWKNILLILAAVGTLGIGAYFIIKYKKKADDAKKETSSLQSTVNDLQSQVNDLQGNTDSTNGTTPSIDEGLTKSASLASVATNITNTSLDSTNTILSGNDNTRV